MVITCIYQSLFSNNNNISIKYINHSLFGAIKSVISSIYQLPTVIGKLTSCKRINIPIIR